MEETNLITRTYKKDGYICDIVIENVGSGHINTDVWLSKDGGAVKLFLFNITDKALDEVIELVNNALCKDNTYTSALDEVDVYER